MKRFLQVAALLFALASPTAFCGASSRPLLDAAGNQRYVILLNEGVAESEPSGVEAPARHPSDLANLFDMYGWHKPNVRALVRRLERAYEAKAVNMTSHAVPMFSAHLDSRIAAQIARDPAVSEVIPVNENEVVFSSAPPWDDQVLSTNERIPWGKIAVDTNDALTFGGGNAIYLIDGGIQAGTQHLDLNIVEIAPINTESPTAAGHAQHVAGILGAQMNTGRVRGINPGAPIISVHAGVFPGTPESTGTVVAIDWVLWHAEIHGALGVANLSMNATSDTARDLIARYTRRASTRVLFVQSAGNFNQEACINAYPSTNAWDGIIVVGGLGKNGARVVPDQDGTPGFDNSGTPPYTSAPGSNFGSCVEMYAPSDEIRSTFYDESTPTDRTRIAFLSGTSMAAPHVSALAARYGNNSTTPVQRERYIRGKLQAVGSLQMPSHVQPLSEPVPSRLYPIEVYSDSPYGSNHAAVSNGMYIDGNHFAAGHTAPAWIEFDLGAYRCVTSVRLTPEQFPAANVFHRIHVSSDPYPDSPVAGISTLSYNLEPMSRAIDACGRYVRVETVVNPTWVAWREIEIYGY